MRVSPPLAALAFLLAGCTDSPAIEEPGTSTGTTSTSTTDTPTTGATSDDTTASEPPGPTGMPASPPLTQWVDPFIGTGGKGFGTGSAFPGPQRPFGLARPGPDTALAGGLALSFAHCSGYSFDDTMVMGLSQTRMHGTGIVDYGAISVMPTLGFTPEKAAPKGVMQALDKASEQASPGRYAVTLADGIGVELTATDHVGMHRFTFPEGQPAAVVLDLGRTLPDVEVVEAELTIDDAGAHGFMHVSGGYSGRFGGVKIYFAAKLSRPLTGHGTWDDGVITADGAGAKGQAIGAYFEFSNTEPVVLGVGLSFVDAEHAAQNLAAEAPALDFDAARTEAEAAWEALLGRVELHGTSEREFEIFYSALYHTLLMPTLASDTDGSYRGLDGEVHTADFPYYTDLSLWDTFRTEHPLLTLLYPEFQKNFLRSLARMAKDGGYMPRWPLGTGYTGGMLGESATIVFADSYAKGVTIPADEAAVAYAAMRKTAMAPVPADSPYPGRSGVLDYIELGYVPQEAGGSSVSWTLESAYDDFALASLATALGEPDDAAMFAARAGNYRNTYDPTSGLMVARRKDGSFVADIDPLGWQDFYAEGNAMQYLWYVPHDIVGLAELMGGRAVMLDRLRDLFEKSEAEVVGIMPQQYYWHGNEPDLHAAFIFSALGEPAEAARWSRWIGDRRYNDGPGGLAGNDDAGTLSAWYVLAASGLYPIAGTATYLVGSPRFTRMTLHLAGGDLVIDAPEASADAIYVDAATLDDTSITTPSLRHAELAAGGLLRFDMAQTPGPWGQAP
ncbi:MAG TPA: GH92 family glycosyl hydrolase [Nannocystis sp.]